MHVQLFSELNDDLIFDFNCIVTFEMTHVVTYGLNFVIGPTPMDIDYIYVNNNYGPIRINYLTSMISSTLNYLNEHHKPKLFRQEIDLRDSFKAINKIQMIANEGLLLVGEPALFESKVEEENKVGTHKNVNNIKFLD